ncbi:MAG: bifunctional 3-(3-hydroxy-phenyl)propionate/3-hydroxycinnamic acid hydroxylase [Bacteroidota bacterium]
MKDNKSIFQVLVVGAGPVGLTAAALLGQAGLRTLIIEREEEIFPYPRAVHLDGEVLQIFDRLGLFPELDSALRPFLEARFVDHQQKPFWIERLPLKPNHQKFYARNWFHQPTLERLLHQKVQALSAVTFWKGEAVVDIQQTETVKLQTASGREAMGDFLLACDGAKSFVRDRLNIPLRDLGFHQEWIVVDAESSDRSLPETHIQYANPARPTTYVCGAKGHFRWEFMVLPDEKAENLLQGTRLNALLRPFVAPEDLHILRKTSYTFHALIAERWRCENIFLLGDAAHQMPPFAGQGLCSGLRDAENLSQKLRLILQENASTNLLDDYQREREIHVRKITRGAMFLGKIIQTRNPTLARVRNITFRLIGQITPLRNWIVKQATGV